MFCCAQTRSEVSETSGKGVCPTLGPSSQAHKQNRLDLFGNIQEVGQRCGKKKSSINLWQSWSKSGGSSKRFEAGYVRASGRGMLWGLVLLRRTKPIWIHDSQCIDVECNMILVITEIYCIRLVYVCVTYNCMNIIFLQAWVRHLVCRTSELVELLRLEKSNAFVLQLPILRLMLCQWMWIFDHTFASSQRPWIDSVLAATMCSHATAFASLCGFMLCTSMGGWGTSKYLWWFFKYLFTCSGAMGGDAKIANGLRCGWFLDALPIAIWTSCPTHFMLAALQVELAAISSSKGKSLDLAALGWALSTTCNDILHFSGVLQVGTQVLFRSPCMQTRCTVSLASCRVISLCMMHVPKLCFGISNQLPYEQATAGSWTVLQCLFAAILWTWPGRLQEQRG